MGREGMDECLTSAVFCLLTPPYEWMLLVLIMVTNVWNYDLWFYEINNFSRHTSTFQIHDARKGLGWAGQGVRWGGRGGMAFINLLLINTGKSYKVVKLTKILFRRRIGGVEEKKERKHLKQARSNKACHILQNTNWSTLSCRSSSSIFWRSRGALNANLKLNAFFLSCGVQYLSWWNRVDSMLLNQRNRDLRAIKYLPIPVF